MDPEVIDALRRLSLLTDEQLDQLAALPQLRDADLNEVETELTQVFDEVTVEEPDENALAAMSFVASAVEAVRTERAGRPDLSAQAQTLIARIVGEPAKSNESGRVPSMAGIARRLKAPVRASVRRKTRSRAITAAGMELDGTLDIASAMCETYRQFRGEGTDGRVLVASVEADVPDDRRLDGDEASNLRKIQAVTGPETLVASGGLCAPLMPFYDLALIASAERPVRDALVQFNADRGGIRYITPPRLVDAAGAVGVWTVANDANPTNPTTKPYATVTCGVETSVQVQAITEQLDFGNIGARAFPEQVQTWMGLAAAQHARRAERELLLAISAGSTKVTSGQLLGAARDLLTTIDRAAASYRSRNRMGTGPAGALHLILPDWAKDLMRADLVRQLPGDSDQGKERLASTDAEIDHWFAVRRINVTYALDGEQTTVPQEFGGQAAGALLGWPLHVYMYLYAEGSWLFLDGGVLDLGLIRDSVLNATNRFRMFQESFEAAALVGVESLRIDAAVCPSGATSSTVTITGDCTTGS